MIQIPEEEMKDRPTAQTIKEGEPGFYSRGVRPCNDLAYGFRCTRQIYHEGPHASHYTRGIEGSTKLVPVNANEPDGEKIIVPKEPGMKTEETIQVATWL
jgi:hypothetical protein